MPITPERRSELLQRKKELLLKKQAILTWTTPEEPWFFLAWVSKVWQGLVWLWQSLVPWWEDPFTSRELLRTAAWVWKIIESPIVWAFKAFEPDIQTWVEALFKDVPDETKTQIASWFAKVPDTVKSFFVDVLEAAWLLWPAWALAWWTFRSSAKTIWKDILKETWEQVTKAEAKQLWKLWLETVPWKIDDIAVDIPKVKKWVVEIISWPLRETDTKVLAWRALSPRTVWKSAKQKLASVADVERRAKTFHKNVRTWVLKWEIDTIENAAQTVVDNIDTVWERIWNAVKAVEGNITLADDVALNVDTALKAKWSTVSPASPILQKFKNDIAWELTIEEAFDLKKLYSNEVSKLYRSWDSWTKQFEALSNWVKNLNSQIDEIIDTQLWSEFASDKALFRELKLIVDDITASALVEGRRSPNTLAEQIGMIEWLLSPIESVKSTFIKEIAELNTRWWAWKELVKILDDEAIWALSQ